MIYITKTTLEEAQELGQIQIDAWRNNYPNPALGITEEDIRLKTEEWEKTGDIRIINKLTEPGVQTWSAKEGNTVVGFIGIKCVDSITMIEALFVSPLHQRKGIGSMLMKHVLSQVKDSEKVSLEVLFHNQNAINFYKSFGFIEQGEISDNPLRLPSGKTIASILMTYVT